MEILWAPWRMDYILGPKPDTCVLCLPEHREEDAERLVLYRGRHAFVVMNKYPYNNGHLLVSPYRHTASITNLTKEEGEEIFFLLQESTKILQQCCNPQGFNMGLNLGASAGAGVREHIHFHIVPRWDGDASFMTVTGEIRVIPEHLSKTWATLRPYFDKLPQY